MAYLPNLGKVRLRLTAKGPDKEKLANAVDEALGKLPALIGDIIYGFDDEETVVDTGELLHRGRLEGLGRPGR